MRGCSRALRLKCEESALTGRIGSLRKGRTRPQVAEDAPLGDRTNMIFSGCSDHLRPRPCHRVTATGMDTEMGKIAGLLDNEEEHQTPSAA